MKRFNRKDGKGTVYRHPRTLVKHEDSFKVNPENTIQDLWNTISYLEETIEKINQKYSQKVSQLEDKVRFLSRRHQNTRNMALKCRNTLFPLSPDAISEIRNDIKSKKEKRIKEKIEISKKEINKLIRNEQLKKESKERHSEFKNNIALKT